MIEVVALSSMTSLIMLSIVVVVICSIFQSRRRIKQKQKWYNDTSSEKLKFERSLLEDIKKYNKDVKESLVNDPDNKLPDIGTLGTLDGEYTFENSRVSTGDCIRYPSKLDGMQVDKNKAGRCVPFRVHKLPYVQYNAFFANPDNSKQENERLVREFNQKHKDNPGDHPYTTKDGFFLTLPEGCLVQREKTGENSQQLDIKPYANGACTEPAIFVAHGKQYSLKYPYALFSKSDDKPVFPAFNNYQLRRI
jgi:hypothetical protein